MKNILISLILRRFNKKEDLHKDIRSKKGSYSQYGEDLIIDRILFDILKLQTMSYLDIGCSDPISISNTYYFYKKGYSGICVDPEPTLNIKYQTTRPDDKFVNLAISDEKEDKRLNYYVMDGHPALNTLDKDEADKLVGKAGIPIKETLKVKTMSINSLLEKYCKEVPDLLSIDVEGKDFSILQSLDYKKYRPKVIVVEVGGYLDRGPAVKKRTYQYRKYLDKKDYYLYAKSGINCTFIDKKCILPKLLG